MSDVQLWVTEPDDSLWSVRSDGIKISTEGAKHKNFFHSVPLENTIDAVTEVFPSSLGWNDTKEIVLSLQMASEKVWNTWKQFRIFNIPGGVNGSSRRMVLIVADSIKSDTILSTRTEICNQYLSKIFS